MTAAQLPLQGLRVLDCATLDGGPTAASLLAELGADVIRVEPPGGDPLRADETAPVPWAAAARGCRSLTLLLSAPRGAEILLQLVEDADVLVERFPPGRMEEWGLGPDELRAANPGLVVVRGDGDGASASATALACLWWRRHGGAGIGQVVELGRGTSPIPSPMPGAAFRDGPPLGRHTEEIFAELGLTRGELEDLRADGVV